MHRLIGRLLSPGGGRFFGPGEIRAAVLSLLFDGPAHGYELMTRLEEKCGGAYKASAGTIYPTLQQLEDEQLVRVRTALDRKVYELTAAGRRELESRAEEISRIWRRAEEWREWGAIGDPGAGEVLGPALRLLKVALKTAVKSHGDPDVIDQVRRVLDEARFQIERMRSRK
jgi:DNA-binding PadR family transcriptional regulator